jgi:putative transposase
MHHFCLDITRYGYRRVTEQLKREGWLINHKKVQRIMREKGWLCRPQKRKWIGTTDSNHRLPVYPNLIQDLRLEGINQLWVADITYIHILVCFIYLAMILDVFPCKAIGYALSRSIDTQLTLSALRMAIVNRNPAPSCIYLMICRSVICSISPWGPSRIISRGRLEGLEGLNFVLLND